MFEPNVAPPWIDRLPNELFSVKPVELKLPVRRDPVSCSFQLSNKSDKHVSFRVKTTNPYMYSVQPKSCILLPRSQINVTVTMRALKGLSDIRCTDKFLVQCVAVPPGTTLEEITPEMFDKEAENHVEECRLNSSFTYRYVDPVEETSGDHTADSSGSSDHKITSPKLLKWWPRRYGWGPRRYGWGPRRYNGGGGMSIHYVLLIAVLGFVLGYYVRS